MPELWTILIAVFPLSFLIGAVNKTTPQYTAFFNLIVVGLIGLVYLIAFIFKKETKV